MCISHSKVQFQPSFSSAKCTSRRRSGPVAVLADRGARPRWGAWGSWGARGRFGDDPRPRPVPDRIRPGRRRPAPGASPPQEALPPSASGSPTCSRARHHAKRLAPGATYVIPGLLTAIRPASRDAIPAGTEALLTKSRGQEDRDPPDEEDSFNRVSGPRSDSRSGAADADGEDERQDHHRTRVGGGRSHQGVGGNQETAEGGGSR